MSKYVPPSLRNERNNQQTPSTQSTSSTPSTPGTLTRGTMASLTPSRGTMASLTKPKTVAINITSDDDFPTLGAPKPVLKTNTETNTETKTASPYIKMAKDWGKKLEEEKEANIIRIRNAEDERHKVAKEGKQEIIKYKNKMIISGRKNEYYDNKDGKFKPIVEDDISDDCFESGPSHEDDEIDNDPYEDDELNANLVCDRRHRDELY